MKRIAARCFSSKSSSTTKQSNRTIYALSTAPGRAGIAVVRISGPNANSSLQRLLRSQSMPAVRRASLRSLHDTHGSPIDDALVVRFSAPHSFTGHDVVELNVHGSVAVVRDLLATLQQCDELEPATAGEFTRQAFVNSRLDLTEVEGLADLIAAETSQQRRQALRQLRGELGALYNEWRSTVVEALARSEALIDFGDDELIDNSVISQIQSGIEHVKKNIETHLNDRRRGERLREGLSLCLGGPVNVGKSSLINLLAQRQLSIVSPIAGTTRDIIETALDIAGYPVSISDTAGIRESSPDSIEKIGIDLARERFSQADIRIHITDTDKQALLLLEDSQLDDKTNVIVRNKIDISPSSLSDKTHNNVVLMSCKTGKGLDQLLQLLENKMHSLTGGEEQTNASTWPAMTRERHRQLAQTTCDCLEAALNTCNTDLAMTCESLRQAASALGELTGETVTVDELLSRIMTEFCIGK